MTLNVLVKKSDVNPVGMISHSKQMSSMYPAEIVSGAVTANVGEAPRATLVDTRSVVQVVSFILQELRTQSVFLVWVNMAS